MGLRERLASLAAGAPLPVFAIAGPGAREAVQDLRLEPSIRLVDSPAAAMVLLVAGAMPESLAEPLLRLHDMMPHPRATAWWPLGAARASWVDRFPGCTIVDAPLANPLKEIQRALLSGRRPSEPPILPNEDPAPWRGVGPYGQGGTGMTGGTPYGRPMAELAADRDGLRLDALPLRVGPFFPRFPAGLALDLSFAGDIVLSLAEPANPFAAPAAAADGQPGPLLAPFLRALSEPVSIAELELARAQSHLRWLAGALVAVELHALGLRALRLAHGLAPASRGELEALARLLPRTGVFTWSARGVGRIPAEALAGLGVGPVARAAGLREDLRLDDPAYRALGFEPVVHNGGDAAARWRQRLAEAAQSLDLAARAGARVSSVTGAVESPRGRLDPGGDASGRLLPLLPGLLQGIEWGDAVTTLVSLDLDLEAAAFVRPPVAETAAV